MGLVTVLWLEGAGCTAWWGPDVPRALPPHLPPGDIFKPVWGSLYTAKLSPAAAAGEHRDMLCWGGSAGLGWWHHGCPGEGGMVASWGQGKGLCSQQRQWIHSPSFCPVSSLPPLLHALVLCSEPPDELLYLSRRVVAEVCSSDDT